MVFGSIVGSDYYARRNSAQLTVVYLVPVPIVCIPGIYGTLSGN